MRDLNYVMASHSSIEYCQLYVEVGNLKKVQRNLHTQSRLICEVKKVSLALFNDVAGWGKLPALDDRFLLEMKQYMKAI